MLRKFSLVLMITIIVLAFLFIGEAKAWDGRIDWDKQGGGWDNLPCESGGHWVLSPAKGITSATLSVSGVTYPMSQNGNGSFAADSSGVITVDTEAFVDYDGVASQSTALHLSHCIDGEPTPTPTNTEMPPTSTPTSTPTQTQPPTPTGTPPTPTPTITPTEPPVITPTPPVPPTETPTEPAPTQLPNRTPIPPQPANAYNITSAYPGELVASVYMNSRNFELYDGVAGPDGVLMLPTASKGASLYQGTIWVHRLWNSGWLQLNKGDLITITENDGTVATYRIAGSSYAPYGVYYPSFSKYSYIASCYSDKEGWAGVIFYRLQLADQPVRSYQRE